jgi:hypothetical protein
MIKRPVCKSALLMIAAVVSGCASTPNVKTTYYLPRAVTQIQVTQTFLCPIDTTSQDLSVAAAVTATTSYVADYSMPEQSVDFGGYSTPFADTDLTVTRSPDKRLLGINSTSTGQGSTILQDVISLGTAIAGVAGAAAADTGQGPGAHGANGTACSVVRAHYTGDPKNPPTLSLTYSASIIYGDPATMAATQSAPSTLPIAIDPTTTPTATNGQVIWRPAVTLSADPASAQLQGDLRNALPTSPDPFTFQLSVTDAYSPADDAIWADASKSSGRESRVLRLNRVFNTDLELSGPVFLASGPTSSPLWRAAVAVPIHDTYPLPLPSPALFGKTAFTLSLTDAGVISKLEYSTTGGAGDALSTATALAKAIQPATPATQASEVQSKADLIYEQQRYTLCKSSPASCPSK